MSWGGPSAWIGGGIALLSYQAAIYFATGQQQFLPELLVALGIVLACAEGLNNKSVGERLGCHPDTVGKWRARFMEHRLDGLYDEPRPGRPRTISVDQVEEVVVATLESTPENATLWSRAAMAAESGVSKSTIGRIW
jgi:transposase